MPNWVDSMVCCPFYKREEGKFGIVCEGYIQDTVAKNIFRSEKRKREHMKRYCCENYIECPFCRVMEEKYE